MIHTIKKSRSKNGLVVIKIHLDKAYNLVRWDYLRKTLMYPKLDKFNYVLCG